MTLTMQQQFYTSPESLVRAFALAVPCGWYGVEVLKEMPRVARKDLVSRHIKGAPLSLCMQPGKPNKQNSDNKHSVTMDDFIFLHGKTNGKRECSSMTISRYG